jgi:hypothetical protein
MRKELSDYPTMSLVSQEVANGFMNTVSYTQQKISVTLKNEGLKGVK